MVFQHVPDGRLIQDPIRLRPGGTHRRPLAAVQHPELDAGAVGGPRHGATERVDFLDQVALADPADGRITGHLAQRLNVVGQQQGLAAHARGRQRGLGTGVATTNDNDIETGRKLHSSPRKSGG